MNSRHGRTADVLAIAADSAILPMVQRCRALTTWHPLAVDRWEFWTLVGDARTASGAGESPGRELIQRLASLSGEGILAFAFELEQERNSLYRSDVWAAAYSLEAAARTTRSPTSALG